jgi:hypothetical protein
MVVQRARPSITHVRSGSMLKSIVGDPTVKFEPGDFIKFEIKDEKNGRIRVDVAPHRLL